MSKYPIPKVLQGKCNQEDYTHWLYYKATARVKRDRKQGNIEASTESYKNAIHKAVCEGGDRDADTGLPLRWDLIRTYDNENSKEGKRGYKKQF